MSAGSGASNLGYGNITPNSNINGRFVNPDNSHNPGPFGSNQIPGLPGLAGAKNNVDAALGYVPGICFSGGSKHFKHKIKKISNKYKMKNKKFTKRMKSRIRSAFFRKSKTNRKTRTRGRRSMFAGKRSTGKRSTGKRSSRSRSRSQSRSRRGGGAYPQSIPYPPGYSQYQNNLPMTPSYSVGGILTPVQVGMATPPPIQVLPSCTNCTDNYNHFTGTGFASRGH
jgi:hypothetical protein